MLLAELVTVSAEVASTRSRSRKIELLAVLLRRLSPDEALAAVSFLTGKPRQSRLGVGWATLRAVEVSPAAEPVLEIVDVDQVFQTLTEVGGAGSKQARESQLEGLMARATPDEQDFLRGLIMRNLRQGALEGVMADAVALALEVPADRVRRAAMLEGDLVAVASRALAEGPASLGESQLSPLTPVQPMLAATASTAGEAVSAFGTGVVEWKLDGARIQVHRDRDRVAIFTRNLREVSSSLPGIVESSLQFDADSFILDGEMLLIGATGRPVEFQESMSNFSTEGRPGPPLSAFYFDCLHLDGRDLIDEALRERRNALEKVVPASSLVGSITTDDPADADRFFEETVAAGHEGVVVKDPALPYEAGRRGSGWLKVKPTHTLDLVVLGVEWGSGRRQGWLSNLHLGARDGQGGLVMLGKTFKGLTDQMLQWQTEKFLAIEDHREGNVVFVRPEVVYEIAFDGVQRSTRYPGGVALRFARVKRYREDKRPEDADTIETVRGFMRG